MEASANFRGTSGIDRGTTYWIGFADGSHERVFDLPGVKIMAKSGTAEAPAFRRMYDGGEEKPDGTTANAGDWKPKGAVLREGDHGWVVALVQPDGEPRPPRQTALDAVAPPPVATDAVSDLGGTRSGGGGVRR